MRHKKLVAVAVAIAACAVFVGVYSFIHHTASYVPPSPRSAYTRSSAQHIRRAIFMWRMSTGSTTCPELDQLISEKVIDQGRNLDAWQNEFAISCDQFDIIVKSAGPDKIWSTSDDIVVGDPNAPPPK